jgi:hypothetical protein
MYVQVSDIYVCESQATEINAAKDTTFMIHADDRLDARTALEYYPE